MSDLANEARGTLDMRVYETTNTSFHPKAYLFYREDRTAIAYVGSSNLSESALRHGVEWNYRVVSSDQGPAFSDVADAFDELFQHPATRPVDDTWIREYQARRRPPAGPVVVDVGVDAVESPPEPHEIQREALEALAENPDAPVMLPVWSYLPPDSARPGLPHLTQTIRRSRKCCLLHIARKSCRRR